MNGWMLKIQKSSGNQLKEAWFAGRKAGEYFGGTFTIESVMRCYEFSHYVAVAHTFTRASDAFQVLTILKDAGIVSTVHVLTDQEGEPTSVEAGFVVEVTHSEECAEPRYLASQFAGGKIGALAKTKQGAVVLDFMTAMDMACRVEQDKAGLARLVQVQMKPADSSVDIRVD